MSWSSAAACPRRIPTSSGVTAAPGPPHHCLDGRVCTGSIYLAAAGILDGQRPALTGHAPNSWNAAVPATPGSGWWNAGKVITAAGVSAGIDTALTLLARAHGPQLAQMVQLAV